MSQDLLIILGSLIGGFILVIWFLNRKLGAPKTDQALTEWLKSITSTLQQSDKNVTDTLQKSYQELNQRMDNEAKVIGELKSETGKFLEIGRSMKDLQDFLNSPKLRGNLGETVLNELLSQTLPKQVFSTQYRFASGEIVDVVIKTQAGLIPIDSKFPMENFTKMNQAPTAKDKAELKKLFIRDVKKHIKDIAGKYIQTGQGTVDFAVMYLPSESLYYEAMANTPEVYNFAQENRILPVSPATFYAFLRTILMSFEGQRIAQEAQSILRNLKDISKTSADFAAKLDTLSRHLTNAYNNMNSVSADFNRLHGKIDDTQSLSSGIQDKDLPEISN